MVYLLPFVAFFLTWGLTKLWIHYSKIANIGKTILQEGPDLHMHKQGTPTMGGLFFMFSILLTTMIYFFVKKDFTWSSLLIFSGLFTMLGYLDDKAGLTKKSGIGLKAWQKFFLQTLIAVLFLLYVRYQGLDTRVFIPFLKKTVDFGIWFYPFAFFVLIGTDNAVNLADGLDGLASGLSISTLVGFAFVAYFLNISMYPSIVAIAILSILAFMMYNVYPAKIFMGDSGSLGLGSFIAIYSILTKTEIFLVFSGIVFLIDTLSVIIQISSVKLFHRRVFKMSPIHHSFELSGIPENQIVFRMWVVQIFGTIIAVLGAIV
jgi:phospho-N-acetylmuramoyl-pentapeptide-transferase